MMDNTISEMTRKYWVETLLGWAERRLAPPQYDECQQALKQAADERDAAVAEVRELRQALNELIAHHKLHHKDDAP